MSKDAELRNQNILVLGLEDGIPSVMCSGGKHDKL